MFAVELNQRLGFAPEDVETGFEDLEPVVASLFKHGIVPVADSDSFGRPQFLVVYAFAEWANPSMDHSRN